MLVQHTAFLCATLLSEVNSVFHLSSQLLGLAGAGPGNALLTAVRGLDKATFVIFRCSQCRS